MIMVAGSPQRDERALPPDEPGRRAVAGPFGHLGQRQADSPQLPGQVRCHWFLPTRLTPGPPVGLWKPTVTGDREAEAANARINGWLGPGGGLAADTCPVVAVCPWGGAV